MKLLYPCIFLKAHSINNFIINCTDMGYKWIMINLVKQEYRWIRIELNWIV